MTDYRVNDDAVRKARELIDAGEVDTTTEWSQAAPSTDQENALIDEHGHEAFARWHLAVDPSASEGTKGRYGFPYGGFSTVNRAALVAAKQRAAQNDHDQVAAAADALLQRIDDARS